MIWSAMLVGREMHDKAWLNHYLDFDEGSGALMKSNDRLRVRLMGQ